MLRTRLVPVEIEVLLSIVNKLPRDREVSHHHVVNPTHHPDGSTPTQGPHSLSIDEESLRYFLDRAIDRFPADLKVFVRPDHNLLEREAEGWKKTLGPLMFECALAASGGLFHPEPLTPSQVKAREALKAGGQISFPHEGKPFFGLGEVEAMRQRYLFLFALREVFEATSQAHISLDDARRRLNQLESQLSSFRPSIFPIQVEAFRGRFDIGKKDRKKKTHNLGYAKPQITWVLEKVEVERIRKCPVCEKLFWAGRLDQSACRSRCSNVLRAKKWREKYAAKYTGKGQAAVSDKAKGKITKGRKKRSHG